MPARAGLDDQHATQPVGQRRGDTEAQTCAGNRFGQLAAEEALCRVFGVLRMNSPAGVAYLDDDDPFARTRHQGHGAPARCELGAVVDQFGQDLLDERGVGPHIRQVG